MTANPADAATSYRRDAAYVAVARMAPLGVQILATPVVLASLGEDAFAVWSLLMTTINLLLTADMGVVGIMQRYHGVARGRQDARLGGRITASVLAVLVVMLVVATAAGPLIARAALALTNLPSTVQDDAALLFQHAGTLALLQLIALAFSSYLAAHGRFGAVLVHSLGARTALGAGIAVALLTGTGLPGLLAASYADAGIAVLLGAWFCRTHLLTEVRRLTTREETRELWAYAWRNQASSFGFVAQRQLDVLMGAVLLSSGALASMSAAAPLTSAVCLAPAVLLTPLFTNLSVQAGADESRLAKAAADAERQWFALTLPFSAVVLGVLPFAGAVWVGPELQQIRPVIAVLAVGFLVSLTTSVLAIHVRAAGQPGIETRAYVAYTVVKVVVGAGLALVGGLLGLAAAGIVAAVAAVAVFRHRARDLRDAESGSAPDRRTLGLTAALLVGSGGASWLLSGVSGNRLVSLVLLGMVGAACAGVVALDARRRARAVPR